MGIDYSQLVKNLVKLKNIDNVVFFDDNYNILYLYKQEDNFIESKLLKDIFLVSDKLKEPFSVNLFYQHFMDFKEGKIVIEDVSDNLNILVYAKGTVNLGRIRYELKKLKSSYLKLIEAG